jgi:hypothetical protein
MLKQLQLFNDDGQMKPEMWGKVQNCINELIAEHNMLINMLANTQTPHQQAYLLMTLAQERGDYELADEQKDGVGDTDNVSDTGQSAGKRQRPGPRKKGRNRR